MTHTHTHTQHTHTHTRTRVHTHIHTRTHRQNGDLEKKMGVALRFIEWFSEVHKA
jgi:hypothetical protein